jgi:hypothetical protein
MAAQEHRRVVNQGILVTEADRLFAETLRRLLLKAVSMIEDRYGLRAVHPERKGERASIAR